MCVSASSLLKASGELFGGAQQSSQLEWQAKQASADAQASVELGKVRADKTRKAGKYQQSSARAALAASGVETGAGTAVKIQQQIERDAEYDAQQELLSGRYSSERLHSEAAGLNQAAHDTRLNSYMRAGGSLLEGNSSGNWKKSKGAS